MVGGFKSDTFCVYCVRNGPRLVDYNHKLMCIPPTHSSPFSLLKIEKSNAYPTLNTYKTVCVCVCVCVCVSVSVTP